VAAVRVAVARIRKALAGAAASIIVAFLKAHGVEVPNDAVQLLLETGFVAGVVWIVPNAKPVVGTVDDVEAQ